MTQGGVNRGLAFLREQQEKSDAFRGERSGVNQLWGNVDERPEFWFLNDGDTMYTVLVHGEKIARKNGSGVWTKDVLCGRDSYDEPKENCKLCARREEGDERVNGPWWRTVSLIYVTRVLHLRKTERNSKLELTPRPTSAQGTVYEQTLGELRIFVMKDRVARQAVNIFLGLSSEDLFEEGEAKVTDVARTGDLINRPYILEKTGTGQQTVELLKGLKPRNVPDSVAELRRTAPEKLIEVAFAKFGQETPKARTAAAGQVHLDPDDIGPVELAGDSPVEYGSDDAELIDV